MFDEFNGQRTDIMSEEQWFTVGYYDAAFNDPFPNFRDWECAFGLNWGDYHGSIGMAGRFEYACDNLRSLCGQFKHPL